MIIDAVVIAGGRSSRLGGTPKTGLVIGGRTLLERTLDAVAAARLVVVVGDRETIDAALADRSVTVVREDPPFSGPAAAIGAGVDFLTSTGRDDADFTLVLACDMPQAAEAVDALVSAVRLGSDGAVAVSSDGRIQPLAGLYSSRALVAGVRARRATDGLDGTSVRALLASLNPDEVRVPAGSTDDIDTWHDAAVHGATSRATPSKERS